MDAMQLANSLPMWLACGTAVFLVVVQAVIFTKKAMDAAPKVGLTNDQVKRGVKTALHSLGRRSRNRQAECFRYWYR